MAREMLNEDQMNDVVGGSFNWWKAEDGTRMCLVTSCGKYKCTADAKDTYAWLKAEHRGEGWTEADYVKALIDCGDFTPV